MKADAATRRAEALKALAGTTWDLLIIGGGIVGSGIARDAAMRGLRVALVEQHDFAFGTSSRSSRLLHGGMRYLAQGRIGLVHEASVEKKIVHHIAPHIADPLPFFFPSYRGNPEWALWKLKIGVKLYDLLCGGRNLGRSTWLSKGEALARVPLLKDQRLSGAVRYFDGLTNDARLVLDTLRSAERAGATLLNYTRFVNAQKAEGNWRCDVLDQLTNGAFVAPARCVINATGPWADGLPHSQVKLRLTKGIHLVIDSDRLPVPDAIVLTEGRRILFVIPWAERVILGTTDTDYNGSLEDVFADPEDIRYVLRIVNAFFPRAKLTGADVISAWAGLRPLIADPDGKPSDISRSHEINSPEPGWWDVAGGKLTTYRLMAEQTVDAVAKYLKTSKALSRDLARCRTAEEPLLPAAETKNISGIAPPPFTPAAVEHFCAREWAVHLDDVMVRRTSWHYYHRDADSMAAEVARQMAGLLHWSRAAQEEELQRCRQRVGHVPGHALNSVA